MINKVILIILFVSIQGCGIKHQRIRENYNIQHLENRALTYFGYKYDFNDQSNAFILDNENITRDSLLLFINSYKKEDLGKIEFKKNCKNPAEFEKCSIQLNIESNFIKQSDLEKDKILQRTKDNLASSISKVLIRPDTCEKCKLIIVNHKPLGHREAQFFLNNLNLDSIIFIADYDTELNPIYFGSSAKAGWVEVWTK